MRPTEEKNSFSFPSGEIRITQAKYVEVIRIIPAIFAKESLQNL